jgi:hypothetical protein
LPWFVAFGIAQPNAASSDGYYYTIAPYLLDQSSRDHAAEITMAIGAGNQMSGDRSVMAIVRCDGSADNWVGAVSHWGGTNSCQILTCINRVVTIQKSATAPALVDNDLFRLTADGARYTVQKTSGNDGTVTQMCEWVDENTIYPFAFRHTGFGFQHVRVGGGNYMPPGMTLWWRGGDLRLSPNVNFLNAWFLVLFGFQTWPTLTGPATNARGIALTGTKRRKGLGT